MRLMRPLLVLAALSLPLPVIAARYFVSPSGAHSGDGTLANPWDLQTALSQPPAVEPGDTIWLLPGTYGDGSGTSIFDSQLTGTSHRPIVVRQHPSGRATINGGIEIHGANTWFWGFEITSSIRDRTGLPDGTSALKNAVDCYGPGTRLINLVIHDTRQGIGMWVEAVGAEAYGNIIYNNGFQAPDRGHGHGIYVQNRHGTKLIAGNIIFNQFGVGIHAYATAESWVRRLELDGNIVFNNGAASAESRRTDNILLASGSGLDKIVVDGNYTYHTPDDNIGYSRLGWEFDDCNGSLTARGNYFIGGQIAAMVNRWKSVSFEHNVTYSVDGLNILLDYPPGATLGPYSWAGNSYYGAGRFSRAGHARTFGAWTSESGLDSTSTFFPGAPSGVWTFLQPNFYEPYRANIVVYNWDESSAVAVDPSSFLDVGVAYEIRDVQDFYGPPVVTGTYEGGWISIPVRVRPVAQPNGNAPSVIRHTAPRFAAFVLLPR